MKKIGIVGSSGGNLYNLGGKEPHKLLGEIFVQAKSAGIGIEDVFFIAAKAPMDNIQASTPACLYTYESEELIKGEEKSLSEINTGSLEHDKRIAKKIMEGKIDGLVVMSSDPQKTHKNIFLAAIEKKIPIAGTGGTSMAELQSIGGNLVAISGTTGTTNRTRAISAITSLSKYFGVKYTPVIGSSSSETVEGNVFSRINFRGIMIGALPAFISMALVLAMSKIPALSSLGAVFDILIKALPVVVAAIAAKQVSGLDEIGIVSGVIAGVLSVNGGIIGGIAGGILAGIISSYIISKCFEFKFPATTANIIAGGLSGLVAGLIVYFFLAPVALFVGEGIKNLIESIIAFSPVLAGVVSGLLIWPAIIGGIYHAAILPIVLLEMESTGSSFLGAVDMVGLVMVSAGITAANIVSPRRPEDKSIAIPGFLINMGFGTFVEAAYPFMFSSKLVFATAVLSSAVAGGFVGLFNVRGTAYVPSVVAPTLANHPLGFLISMLIGAAMSFILTVLINRTMKSKI